MRIGLDLDNTLACHDATFGFLAQSAGVPENIRSAGKRAVRDFLRSEGREVEWTAMQGRAYGELMPLAVPFEGARDFVRRARLDGHAVFVVSHRTRHPFSGDDHDLHLAATNWLWKHRISVWAEAFFELDSAKKAARIVALGCDVFVDDLPEFLARPDLASVKRKILFQPRPDLTADFETARTWSAVGKLLLKR